MSSIAHAIHKMDRLVFSTREMAGLAGVSVGSATQSLKRLEQEGIVKKIFQGVWAQIGNKRFTPFLVLPYLALNHRVYLSFISALHIYNVISQIPQVITVASTAHTKILRTPIAAFHIHQIMPDFFCGFDWHGSGDYLIATPEKALVDCLYLASRRGKFFANFPEMDVDILDKKLIRKWIGKIKSDQIRKSVTSRMEAIFDMR